MEAMKEKNRGHLDYVVWPDNLHPWDKALDGYILILILCQIRES